MELRVPKKAEKPVKKKKRVRKVAQPPPKRKLALKGPTPQQLHAIDNYFKNGGHMRKAALEAGFSDARIFGHEEVQIELEKRRNKLARKNEVTEERIIAELAKVAFGGIGDLIEVRDDGTAHLDFSELTQEQRATITEFSSDTVNFGRKNGKKQLKVVKQRIKFANKMEALQQLARIFGMNEDKTTHTIEADDEIIEALFAGRKRAAAESAKDITDVDYEEIE